MKSSTSHASMRVMDMTTGHPLRLILAFALPLFIGNLFQQAYSMVDTMVAGYNLGNTAIAAIGATSSLYSLLIDFASGLNSGYAIVVTQQFGARNSKALRESVAGMIELDIRITTGLTILSLVFLKPLMHFMNTPDSIFNEAYSYIVIICAGMPATIAYNLFASILRAVGNSRTSLYFLMVSTVLNIVLDLFFIMVLHTGVGGAALATIISQAVSALLSGLYVYKHYRSIMPKRQDFRVPHSMLTELFSQGIAMGLMLCVVDIGSVIFQRANNSLGEMIISAHTSSRRIIGIMMQPINTIATASSTFIGQNWGAGKTSRIRQALKQVLSLEIAWSVTAFLLVLAFGSVLVRWSTGTTDAAMVENAVMSLRLHLAFFPALSCLLVLRTALQAMGRKLIPILSSCLELGMKILAAAVLIPRFGFLGTSITEPITWTLMLLFLAGNFWIRRKTLFHVAAA